MDTKDTKGTKGKPIIDFVSFVVAAQVGGFYRVQNKRAPRYCDAPLLHWSGSPSNSRRRAVIRPATCPDTTQWACLRICEENYGMAQGAVRIGTRLCRESYRSVM